MIHDRSAAPRVKEGGQADGEGEDNCTLEKICDERRGSSDVSERAEKKTRSPVVGVDHVGW